MRPVASSVKRAFKYRFYPTDARAVELSRTFGCVRKVYNLALEARNEAHLQNVFADFFAKRAGPPRFKSRMRMNDAADYTASAFRWRAGQLTPAKMAEPLNIGEKVADPRHERRDRVRLAKAQHELARIAPGSRNREKARLRVARIRYGRELIVVDRWFPSSKRCSTYGSLRGALPLRVRAWTCESCGACHDRDVNAAVNTLAAGLAVAVCGDGVRPRRDTAVGRSSTKQEDLRREQREPTPREWDASQSVAT